MQQEKTKRKASQQIKLRARQTGGRQAHKRTDSKSRQLVVLEAEKDGSGFKLSFVRNGYKSVMRRHIGKEQFIGFELLDKK